MSRAHDMQASRTSYKGSKRTEASEANQCD